MNSLNARSTLKVGTKEYEIYRLDALDKQGISTKHLPYSLRILLENLLRTEDGQNVKKEDIRALAAWNKKSKPDKEIAFTPSRVLLQDFTGVPAIVDLAAMRDAMKRLSGDPTLINPLQPAELVIDHSVQVDEFGTPQAFQLNSELEFLRNKERYAFLRWGQTAFRNLAIVPPDTGIVHQVNLEYLARVVFVHETNGHRTAYPDTLVGTDSHTTMINGLGVLGWGVGGIEAEAAMLGQPVSMVIPQVVGVKLTGKLREGATATDLVLTITEMLRKHGVVGKFVEYFGPGLQDLPLADRATIGNMSPEYGATCGIFPVDKESLNYLRLTGRSEEQIALVEAYSREQGLFHDEKTPEAEYAELLALDLASVEPSLAGPKRPQDRVALSNAKDSFEKALPSLIRPGKGEVAASGNGHLKHGSVVIAAITSCTNTSNPSVMLAAGLLAKKAVERGLKVDPAVKTSLAPGSRVVTDYLAKTGLQKYLDQLGFNLVGYGCTTCIGNSGPLHPKIEKAINEFDLIAASVLSGNRNFEARVHQNIKANFLMSPPLVVAFALAGRVHIDLSREPIGKDKHGEETFLRDLWPTLGEIRHVMQSALAPETFRKLYRDFADQNPKWNEIPSSSGDVYRWDEKSDYIHEPPFFKDFSMQPGRIEEIRGARALGIFGDSVTTDHISPAGAIKETSPAGKYLMSRGIQPRDFNSYGSRRGNDLVMTRGTFANVRIKNLMAPGTEGGVTKYFANGEVEQMSIYDAAMKYAQNDTPLVILAGHEYGSGSSRDWAAKGTRLLGVKAVIAASFERIHRSNLVGMGVLPLQFHEGTTAQSLGLDGSERFSIVGLSDAIKPGETITLEIEGKGQSKRSIPLKLRIDTPIEIDYYRHGGILPFVLRQLLSK